MLEKEKFLAIKKLARDIRDCLLYTSDAADEL